MRKFAKIKLTNDDGYIYLNVDNIVGFSGNFDNPGKILVDFIDGTTSIYEGNSGDFMAYLVNSVSSDESYDEFVKRKENMK